ncbi:cytochrome c1 [Bartonella sp. AR 15-3]|uniref:cytochrome c1 n=1 Tax=Bartonella sp. AR 15-3 TaxID=545617 RepID=UPI0030DADFDB
MCASCHGLKYVSFRALKVLGYNQEQGKAFAVQYEVSDGSNRKGKFLKRFGSAIVLDYFFFPLLLILKKTNLYVMMLNLLIYH